MAIYPKRPCTNPAVLSRSANGMWCNTCCCPQFPVDLYIVDAVAETYFDEDTGMYYYYTSIQYEAYDACDNLVYSHWFNFDGSGTGWERWPCDWYYVCTFDNINASCYEINFAGLYFNTYICPSDFTCNPTCETCQCGNY